jgi:hypothetical protein
MGRSFGDHSGEDSLADATKHQTPKERERELGCETREMGGRAPLIVRRALNRAGERHRAFQSVSDSQPLKQSVSKSEKFDLSLIRRALAIDGLIRCRLSKAHLTRRAMRHHQTHWWPHGGGACLCPPAATRNHRRKTMSPEAAEALMGQIVPRLKAAVPKCVRTVGAEVTTSWCRMASCWQRGCCTTRNRPGSWHQPRPSPITPIAGSAVPGRAVTLGRHVAPIGRHEPVVLHLLVDALLALLVEPIAGGGDVLDVHELRFQGEIENWWLLYPGRPSFFA